MVSSNLQTTIRSKTWALAQALGFRPLRTREPLGVWVQVPGSGLWGWGVGHWGLGLLKSLISRAQVLVTCCQISNLVMMNA